MSPGFRLISCQRRLKLSCECNLAVPAWFSKVAIATLKAFTVQVRELKAHGNPQTTATRRQSGDDRQI